MFKEKEILQKVKGHISERHVDLLKALISDVDEFNEKYTDENTELYIEFDNEGDDSECDPYETFSIRIRYKEGDVIEFGCVHSMLGINQLDDCLCALCCYFEELDEVKEKVCYKRKNKRNGRKEKN
jgi:hypothetical protein